MTDFLLAIAFVMTLLFGHWIISLIDRYLGSLNNERDDTDDHH